MARAKKPRYEYIESKQLYRKRLKGRDGKTVALYGKTPQELSIKIEVFQEDLLNYQDNRENPYVGDYADYWLDLQEGHLSCHRHYLPDRADRWFLLWYFLFR